MLSQLNEYWRARVSGRPNVRAIVSPVSNGSSGEDIALTVALFEYQTVLHLLTMGNGQVVARFNYFVALTAAIIAGTGGIIGTAAISTAAKLTIVEVLSLLLLTVGVLTFSRIIRSDVTRLEYLAMMDLYRGYLLQRAPELKTYSILPVRNPGASKPNWRVHSALTNLALTTALINGAVSGVLTGSASVQILPGKIGGIGGIGVASLIVTVLTHGLWQRRVRDAGLLALDDLLETGPLRDS